MLKLSETSSQSKKAYPNSILWEDGKELSKAWMNRRHKPTNPVTEGEHSFELESKVA